MLCCALPLARNPTTSAGLVPTPCTLCCTPIDAHGTFISIPTHAQAAESINKICQVLSPAQIVEVYLPLLRRLSTGEWFTSRSSATALYASAYTRISSDSASTSTSASAAAEATTPNDPSSSSSTFTSADLSPATVTGLREEMVRMFSALCTDDTPMVRRSAAKEMGNFTRQLDKQTLIKELVPVFRKLSSDDQDSVRLLTVDSLIAIADAMDTSECKTYLGPTMKSMVADKSWRVRYMVADNFVKVGYWCETRSTRPWVGRREG